MTSQQHYRRYRRIALTVALTLVAIVGIYGVTARAIDHQYGEPRCSQVDVKISNLTPVGWEPVGWRVEDGYTGLYCPLVGEWWHLEEDGSISPA